MEISFYTNKELISELLSRTTFAGMIVYPTEALEDLRRGDMIEFEVAWSHRLPEATIIRILKDALEQIQG